MSGCKQLQPVGGLESIHEFKDSFDPFSDVCVRSQSGLRLPQRTRQYNDRLGMSDPRRAITEPAQMSEPAANRKLLPLTGLAVAEYGDELEIFFPTRIGLPAAVVGLLFLLVAGNRLISHRTAEDDAAAMTVNTYRADFQVKARLKAGRSVGLGWRHRRERRCSRSVATIKRSPALRPRSCSSRETCSSTTPR